MRSAEKHPDRLEIRKAVGEAVTAWMVCSKQMRFFRRVNRHNETKSEMSEIIKLKQFPIRTTLIALGVGAFAIGSDAFVAIGMVSEIARDLNLSVSVAGNWSPFSRSATRCSRYLQQRYLPEPARKSSCWPRCCCFRWETLFARWQVA